MHARGSHSAPRHQAAIGLVAPGERLRKNHDNSNRNRSSRKDLNIKKDKKNRGDNRKENKKENKEDRENRKEPIFKNFNKQIFYRIQYTSYIYLAFRLLD